jgi:NADH-quinone oxidoreductase subunit C
MSERLETLAAQITERFGDKVERVPSSCGELTFEVGKDDLIAVATALRNEGDFGFEMLMDVCGVDYLNYGSDEWETLDATDTGFSRGVEREPVILDEADEFDERRFAVVYHLLSLQHNQRLRLRVYTGKENRRSPRPPAHPDRLRLYRAPVPQGLPVVRQRRGAL